MQMNGKYCELRVKERAESEVKRQRLHSRSHLPAVAAGGTPAPVKRPLVGPSHSRVHTTCYTSDGMASTRVSSWNPLPKRVLRCWEEPRHLMRPPTVIPIR